MDSLKQYVLQGLKDTANKEIDKLDQYIEPLAAFISQQTDPNRLAVMIVDWGQSKLVDLVDRIFRWNFLARLLLKYTSIKQKCLDAITKLDKYEAEIAVLITKNVHPQTQASIVVRYAQDKLRKLVEKVFK